MKLPLRVRSARDAQRLRCPRGHVVAPANNHWWCRSCAAHWEDVDSEFDAVRDAETGQMLDRDAVRFEGAAAARTPEDRT